MGRYELYLEQPLAVANVAYQQDRRADDEDLLARWPGGFATWVVYRHFTKGIYIAYTTRRIVGGQYHGKFLTQVYSVGRDSETLYLQTSSTRKLAKERAMKQYRKKFTPKNGR